ncbi:MAG: Maf-like protein [Pseudomonadota bacterium]|nr:septum formation inhibitor Maf [Rubrivivax sp.]NLZ42367.1 septum formation inhibitor Maf [Comamonadaceae bacterium]
MVPLAPRSHAFVYLASASPRRAQLLDQIGVPHRPLVATRQENVERLEEERSGERPEDYVRRVTLAKLLAARARHRARGLPDAPILCADTTVALGRRILGKPADAEDAARMLRALAGRTHRVLSAVAVSCGAQSPLLVSVSHVRFAPLSERVIGAYVASGEPFGKAGAYAVQGRIAQWIERIEGSYSGIVGLPLHETRELLARAAVAYAP